MNNADSDQTTQQSDLGLQCLLGSIHLKTLEKKSLAPQKLILDCGLILSVMEVCKIIFKVDELYIY